MTSEELGKDVDQILSIKMTSKMDKDTDYVSITIEPKKSSDKYIKTLASRVYDVLSSDFLLIEIQRKLKP